MTHDAKTLTQDRTQRNSRHVRCFANAEGFQWCLVFIVCFSFLHSSLLLAERAVPVIPRTQAQAVVAHMLKAWREALVIGSIQALVLPEPRLFTRIDGNGLEVPWSMAFLPNGDLLVTERPGRVRLIQNSTLITQPILTVNTVTASGSERGLLVSHWILGSRKIHSLYLLHRN